MPTIATSPNPEYGLLAALAAGVIVGLERGWRDREVADGGRIAGLRTFSLVGALGGVLALTNSMLLGAGVLALAVVIGVSYREGVRATGNLSATSAVAQLVTFGLGALAATGAPVLAVGAAVIVAVVLDLRSTLHRWLRRIDRRELSAALQMLVLSAVILPLLPDQGHGPYGALNPYRLWWAVVLVAGLSLTGHVAMRLFGAQRGLLLSGLLAGLASSTAATLALARRARATPALLDSAAAGALAACAVMFIRVATIVTVLDPTLGRQSAAPLLGAAASSLAFAVMAWHRRPTGAGTPAALADIHPFDLAAALAFGAFLGLIAVLSEASRHWFGEGGLYGLALTSGWIDVDALSIAVARMSAANGLSTQHAGTTIALAVLANTVAKAAIAWTTGGWHFGWRLLPGYVASIATGLVLFALAP